MSGAATPSATVGMVFECGPQGADKQVGEYLAKHIRPDIGIWPGTLDNKANLLRDDDKVDAVRVLQAAPVTLQRLRRSISFARSESKLLTCGTQP